MAAACSAAASPGGANVIVMSCGLLTNGKNCLDASPQDRAKINGINDGLSEYGKESTLRRLW
jgi:hypothetical protein